MSSGLEGRILMAAITLTAIVSGIAEASGRPDLHPALADHRWQVIAHRGGAGIAPENTLAAFRNAVALGVDAFELDVHATADGVLVVIHDDTVDRTTNGSGAVSDLTLEEIKTLDAAYNFPTACDIEGHPYRGAGVTVPTLEEVFEAFPDTPMVIEIKRSDPPIVDAFGSMLRRYDRAGNTIVASFNRRVLQDFRAGFPEFATSGAESEIGRFFVLNRVFLGGIYRVPMDAFQVPERVGALRVVTPRFVRVAHRLGTVIHVWTINEPVEMERMREADVDGIITDRPDLLLQVTGR